MNFRFKINIISRYYVGKKLTEDELNSLIAHAHRRIEQLQKQLAEQIAMEQQVFSMKIVPADCHFKCGTDGF